MSFRTLQLGPAIADFMEQNPELQIQLVLSDEQVDPVQGGFDVTLRIADLESSSLIARKTCRSIASSARRLTISREMACPRIPASRVTTTS
jgi:DNA-binding transcriptional LysR family regulator